MTWSIIARDGTTGQFGIAVATKFFAVAARVPHIAPGIGGVATQALVNPYYGIDGVRLLRERREPREVAPAVRRPRTRPGRRRPTWPRPRRSRSAPCDAGSARRPRRAR